MARQHPKTIDKIGCTTCDPLLDRRLEESGLPEEQQRAIRAEQRSWFVDEAGKLVCGGETCRLPDVIVDETPVMISDARDKLEADLAASDQARADDATDQAHRTWRVTESHDY